MDMKIQNKNGALATSASNLDVLNKAEQAKKGDNLGRVAGNDPRGVSKQQSLNDQKSVGVSVSDRAREIAAAKQKAFDIAKNTDPVRHDKVAELKAKILSGEYKVDAEKVAHGMLREAVKDELAKSSLEE